MTRVADAWFKQPQLEPKPESGCLVWDWVKLHTCGATSGVQPHPVCVMAGVCDGRLNQPSPHTLKGVLTCHPLYHPLCLPNIFQCNKLLYHQQLVTCKLLVHWRVLCSV